MDDSLQKKLENLKNILSEINSVLISYSGGVDSTLLAVMAKEVLDDSMGCAIIKSPLMPEDEYKSAFLLAEDLGLPVSVIESDIIKDPKFSQNNNNRCYICKKNAVKLLKAEAERLGLLSVADGTNFSDTKVYRPGYIAGCEENIKHPLADAKMTKDDIRKAATIYGLPNSGRPSASCLATRIPYGKKISENNLERIEKAEDIIKNYGVSVLRVREYFECARIETDPSDFGTVLKNREEISEKLKQLGFLYVTLDIDGFVSGSMDRKSNRDQK
ncbi:uncharacterized protein J2128_002218 [Methanomicrobium sp. W14]|uniref:ATP-dependent sacrificial sulfur transferase LarE n=1 Tax=Methanomicrobium sp. W14 TaxID=2817839 RepID=UPI001AE54A21|nr:ATP-dependent sacrificial sulfur transferase LarE [Methanomicrobium sp. W14]MBP2134252.1 uncharacterized protein [Methanomicrobium sp. W14]